MINVWYTQKTGRKKNIKNKKNEKKTEKNHESSGNLKSFNNGHPAWVYFFLLGGIVTILGLGIAYYFGAKENKNNNKIPNPLKDFLKK